MNLEVGLVGGEAGSLEPNADLVRANSAAASWKLTPADPAEVDRILA